MTNQVYIDYATVWGEEYEIRVWQKSKTVWIASGKYMEKSVTAQDRSRNTACAAWANAAKHDSVNQN